MVVIIHILMKQVLISNKGYTKQDLCAICYDEYKENDIKCLLKCGHLYLENVLKNTNIIVIMIDI